MDVCADVSVVDIETGIEVVTAEVAAEVVDEKLA